MSNRLPGGIFKLFGTSWLVRSETSLVKSLPPIPVLALSIFFDYARNSRCLGNDCFSKCRYFIYNIHNNDKNVMLFDMPLTFLRERYWGGDRAPQKTFKNRKIDQ